MSTPSQRTVKQAIKDLRHLIDTSDDPCVQRIAYGMETVIRWVIEDTVGWQKPAAEAQILARMLHDELRSSSTRK